MLRLSGLTLPLDHLPEAMPEAIAKRLGIEPAELKGFSVYRRGNDARRRNAIQLVYTVDVELTDEAAVLAAARQVREALGGETLAGLVNNAGIAVAGPVLELSVDDFRRQMDINVIGPVIATQAFGPLLGADPSLKGPKGRIVMISSVAGKNGNPLSAPYCTSKHAIEGLSESLRRELMLFGIDVIIVAPGAVKTPIWSKAEQVDLSVYQNSPYLPALNKVMAFMMDLGAKGLPAERIAEIVFEALTAASPKVRYQITPDPMRHLIGAVLPKRTVDRIIAKRLGLSPLG